MLYEVSVAGKLVEMLKEIMPQLARVALLFNPDNISAAGFWLSIESVAKSLGAVPVSLPVRNAADIEAAIDAFARESNGGLVLPTDVTTIVHRELIIELAARYRLPAIYSFRADVAKGGLMCYGPDTADLFERAASYVDRILKGEPDLGGFAAANDLVGKSDVEVREAIGDKFPKDIYHSIV
jgi:putative ABC transport system substrate-binding protein